MRVRPLGCGETAGAKLPGERRRRALQAATCVSPLLRRPRGGSALPLSRIAFEATEKGLPYIRELQGCWFSFSSCRLGYLAAWSSTHCIGVDIEDQTRHLEATELAQAYFSRAEAKAVEGAGERTRVRTFFQLWTLKEAALKSIGEGLPFGLDAFQFELEPSIRIVDAPRTYGGPERFCAYGIETAGSCAALAIRSNS